MMQHRAPGRPLANWGANSTLRQKAPLAFLGLRSCQQINLRPLYMDLVGRESIATRINRNNPCQLGLVSGEACKRRAQQLDSAERL